MRKFLLFAPLFALLAAALWFAARCLDASGRRRHPDVRLVRNRRRRGLFAAVGGGLMALVFYSNRHGYDDLSGGDGERR